MRKDANNPGEAVKRRLVADVDGYVGVQSRQGVDRRGSWVAVETETQHRGWNTKQYAVIAVGNDALYQGSPIFAIQDVGTHHKQCMVLAYQFVESERSGFPGPCRLDWRLANSRYDNGVAPFADDGEYRVRILCSKRLHQGAEHGLIPLGTVESSVFARYEGEARGRFRQGWSGCRSP